MTKEGTVLDGKYEIWKEVGHGGMSIVYLARDNRLNKQWAVKEIKNDGSKTVKTLLKGLEREANILKNVDHPVLPRIVDIINQDGTIYVVMDFIEGTTLSDRLKKEGAQPQEDVIEWGLALASALDYLHSMNPPVIYRDMKPSNVMLKPEGGVKLIDFGTAKEYIIENNADTTALGTRGYAAPEQFGDAQGRGIYNTDARTDIYNLGATLYHIVTGKNPCEPPYEIKPIRTWNPALSSGLEKIIIKCTQPNPNDRYQNCKELMYALEHYNELDDEYRKKNKKKLASFITTAALTIVFAGISIFGHAGMNRIKLDNYNTYIETGNDFRVNEQYAKAAEEYKKAFELDGAEAEAYTKFIQVYVDAHNDVGISAENALDLEAGLNVVANRIKAKYSGIEENSEVLYRLAITYFDEVRDYKTAAKYFNMIPEEDEAYGELAGYYKSVSLIMSSTNVDMGELIEEINLFAAYNQNEYTNDNPIKFINYKIIGGIYATYANYSGVAQNAEQVMLKAVEDLEKYTGTELDQNDYFFSFYDNLTTIYETMANEAEGEEKSDYYEAVIEYCDEYLTVLDIKSESEEQSQIGGNNDNIYNTSYYNKMYLKAQAYSNLGDYDKTIETYTELEKKLGKDNALSNKAYAEHIDFIYSTCENTEQDPTLWHTQQPERLGELIAIYEESKDVADISANKTWKKRKNTLDMLVVDENVSSYESGVTEAGNSDEKTEETGE